MLVVPPAISAVTVVRIPYSCRGMRRLFDGASVLGVRGTAPMHVFSRMCHLMMVMRFRAIGGRICTGAMRRCVMGVVLV
jgi:hypothetical protein